MNAPRHDRCSCRSLVLYARSLFTRGLTFWEPALDPAGAGAYAGGERFDDTAHARSHFRSVVNPRRFALYSLAETPDDDAVVVRLGSDDHTLMVVREFRRVPLFASALSLTLFTARPGRSSAAIAALAHFCERAVSLWEPSYLMLAQSLEQPRLVALFTGVHEGRALAAGSPGSFSLDALFPEIRPMLEEEPELFQYCPEERAADTARVSPRAV